VNKQSRKANAEIVNLKLSIVGFIESEEKNRIATYSEAPNPDPIGRFLNRTILLPISLDHGLSGLWDFADFCLFFLCLFALVGVFHQQINGGPFVCITD